MNFKQLASSIVDELGDRQNIQSITHCSTRLRIELKDISKIDLKKISSISGVLKAQFQGSSLQINVGPDVKKVYEEIIKVTGPIESTETEAKGKESVFDKLARTLSGIVLPAIAAISSAALLKAITAIALTFGWLSRTSDVYTVLNMIGDAPFYFLPMILAVTTARKVKVNEFIALTLAGVLMYPTLINGAAEGLTSLNFFGLSIPYINYSTTLLPIIFGVILMKYIYNFLDRYIPQVFQLIITCGLTLIITSIITLVVLAPLGNYLSVYIGSFLVWFFGVAGPIAGGVLGFFYATLVMTGLAYGTFPIVMNNLATVGYDFIIFPIMICSNINQGVASFAASLKIKDKQIKAVAYSSTVSAFCGITEPAMYTINLRYKKPFYATMIGTAVSGVLCSLLAVKLFTPAGVGLPGLAGFVSAEYPNNFMMMIVALLVGAAVTFVLTLVLLKSSDTTKNIKTEISEKPIVKTKDEIYSCGDGAVSSIDSVPDKTFSEKLIGEGCAVDVKDGIIVSPVDGKIKAVYPTNHAVGIESVNGAEILLHIGVDTVKLEGDNFSSHIRMGQAVKRGETLITFNYEEVSKKCPYLATIIIVTNSSEYTNIKITDKQNVTSKDCLITVN